MLLWILFAVMTAAVLAAVLAPLARAAGGGDERGAASVAVYRNQLEEVEADCARGVIDAGEAAATRLEISRRLLAEAGAPAAAPVPGRRHNTTALAAAVLVPVISIGLYLVFGSPGMPGFPAAQRQQMALNDAGIADLVARVEARPRPQPGDGGGWEGGAP